MADIDAIFEACIAHLSTGAAVEACLNLVPPEASEVASLIPIAAALRTLAIPIPEIDLQAREQARSRFLAHAQALTTPSSVPAEQALDDSVGMLASGASIDDCVDTYPHHAAELRPLLDVVADLRHTSVASAKREPGTSAEARASFLDRIAVLRAKPFVSIQEALDVSIQMIAAGATVESCLDAFPHHASELRSLLAAVSTVQLGAQPAPTRSRKEILAQKQTFLEAAAALVPATAVPPAPVVEDTGVSAARPPVRRALLPSQPPAPPWWRRWTDLFRQSAWRGAVAAIVALVLLAGFGRSAVTVASSTLPGDALYPVKRLVEQTRLALTVDDDQRTQLQIRFNQERLDEAKQVATEGRKAPVTISSVIRSIDGATWTLVNLDQPVLVTSDTHVRGVAKPGKRVRISIWFDGQGNFIAREATVYADPAARATPETDLSAPPATATPKMGGVMPIQPTPYRPTPNRPTPVRPTPIRPTPTEPALPTATVGAVITPTATLATSPTPASTGTPTPEGTPNPTPSVAATETSTAEPATVTPEPATATPEPPPPTSEPATATPEPPPPTSEPATATPEPPPPTAELASPTPVPPTTPSRF